MRPTPIKDQKSSPIKKLSNKKANLADRLFDRPDNRAYSQNQRPRIFSNQMQKSWLTPSIAMGYQKKNQSNEQLPPIEPTRKITKMHTESSIIEDIYLDQKVEDLKKMWSESNKKDSAYRLKNKQNFNKTKTRLIDSRMNRTLTQSREVMQLMEKMSGKQFQKNEHSLLESPMRKQQIQRRIHTVSDDTPQNLQQIDAFISLTREGKITEYEFYYLVRRETNDYYNMEIVTYQIVQKRKIQDYFTLSGHGITRYEDARPIQFLDLDNWQSERKQFNEIKELQFFKKFRKWKTLKKWIAILSRRKIKRISDILQQKLFLVKDEYRNMLLSHSAVCYNIQQFKFIEISNQPLEIQSFRQKQQEKRKALVEYMKRCSRQMHGSTNDGFRQIVDRLRNDITNSDTLQQSKDKKEEQERVDEKARIFSQLKFPPNIDYGSKSNIRNEFIKFLRLAYLFDFMAIEALGKMYISNIEYFKSFLIKAEQDGQPQKMPLPQDLTFGLTHNPDGKNIYQESNVTWRPIFTLKVSLTDNQVTDKPVNEQVSFEAVKNNFLKFDLNKFLMIEEAKQFQYYDDTIIERRFIPKLSDKMIKVTPQKQDIIRHVIEFFTQTLDEIQAIDRWGKNQQLKIYTQALEQWDQIIGDNWERDQKRYLNPTNWIKQNNTFRGIKRYLNNSILGTYQAAEVLVSQHNQIINWIWRMNNCDFTILKNNAIAQQIIVFNTTYNLSKDAYEYFQKYLLQKADFYIYSMDFSQMKRSLLRNQNENIKQICQIFSEIIGQRSSILKQWFVESISQLTVLIIRIQEFMDQKHNLERINFEISSKKRQLTQIQTLVTLLQSSIFSNLLKKQDKDIVTDLSHLHSVLFVSINDAESQMPKYIERFRKQIRQTLQKFNKELEELKDTLQDDKFNKNATDIQNASKQLQALESRVLKLQQYSKKHKNYEQNLEQPQCTNFVQFRTTKTDFVMRQKIFRGIIQIRSYAQKWRQMNFKSVDIKQISTVLDKYLKDLISGERILPQNHALPVFRKLLFIFKDAVPVISAIKSPYLQLQDHQKIMKLLKTDIKINQSEDLTFNQFLSMPFQECQQQIKDIAVCATNYFYLKKQLDSFEKEWSEVDLRLKQYKQTSDIIILYDIEELISKLDECLATVVNLLANRYIAPLREKTQKFNNQIILSQEVVEKIIQCQKKWVYLENIFAAQDIKKQLINQAANFVIADKYLKNMMKKNMNAIGKPTIVKLIKYPNILSDLSKTLDLLQEIQKKLQDYLEVKRKTFPRFYFISNDELVQILANSNNITILQKHISKLFQGIAELHFQTSASQIDGMISQEGEIIKFSSPISTRFSIQIWLSNLQRQMVETIKRLVRDGYKDYNMGAQKTRIQWILNHKSQAVITDNQILWTNQTQEYIRQQGTKRDALVQFYQLLVKQLQAVTQLIRTNTKPLYNKIAVALITADVHNRDVVMNLVANEVDSIYDFNWQQQLKYYIEDGELCIIRQVNSHMDYGYEYLGATSRLVITPLTDRCWITITSAISNHLGASPMGPAGTGKTQSTKDLAKGLARVCIVFNCSDQITAQMMSKLFAGLAQQGAWTCLDEFNRIDIEVLSVIAQQLFSIRVGLKKQKGQVEIEGRILPIRKNFGVFITMNPGYSGRTQLPDNLKSLFRPVSMMIPDYTMIAQIMLFAQGFENASQLSRKMVQLYKLASEQLSQQKHYDFGLRAVKSLLVMAGQLKKAESKISQDVVLIKAMKQSNIPKFLQNDIYLFEALITDLFPLANIEQNPNEKLQQSVKDIINHHHLGGIPETTVKVIQLHEVLNIRFGVMIVGESGVGKTTLYRLLKETMESILKVNPDVGKKYYKVQQRVINPKSVSMGQLYGQIDVLSQEWTDGVLSSIIRQCNNCQQKKHYWVTLDGPVDSLWIQNLNTVLDDNLTLCLANGQRIKLRKQLRMLFEVENLEAASPATVSRCGMVYMPSNKNYIYYLNENINKLKLDKDYLTHIKNIIVAPFQEILKAKQGWFQPMPTIKLQVTQVFIMFLNHYLKQNKFTNSYDENIKKLNLICAFSLIWSVGSSIQSTMYSVFQNNLRSLIQVFFPKTQTVFDFFLNPDNLMNFISWQTKLTEFQYPKQTQFHDIIVPTIDTLKYKHIMQIMISQSKPILITGESGVGKTSLAGPYLFSQKENGIQTIFLNFSAKTKPKQTQLAIQNKLTKKSKTSFGPKINEKMVIFIDDINLPELQAEGAQPTIQLLRHFLDFQGFYDRSKLFWKQVVETNLISCGATPYGGRNKLNLRFTRHCAIICIPEPSQSNLKKIFGGILKGFFNSLNFGESVKKIADPIVNATLNFYQTIRKQLLPIPSKFHYQFNLRDISRVFQGMLQCSTDTANSVDRIYQLWYHELQRIFGDRLIDSADLKWFIQNASKISKRFGEGIEIDKINNKQFGIIFTKLFSVQSAEVLYQNIEDQKKIGQLFESKMYEYNMESNGKLQLVFFKEAIQHILRISRILSMPRGNAMLIGVGGSGKQSLSKLSAFSSQCAIHQLEMGRGYNSQSFRADLQKIARVTGVKQKKLCFLFVDTQILYEQFLQSINNMLNTGEVPNLFQKKEEIDEIISSVRASAIKQKKVDNPQSLWSFFISNIRSNLHIVLCMSPAGSALRVRSRKFPSLINCCTIDWFNSWNEQALYEVGKKMLNTMQTSNDQKSLGETRKKFNELCTNANLRISELCEQYYQNERRKVQTTPKTYLDQLDLFNSVLLLKNKELQNNKRILTDGLQKLYSTNQIVIKLKIQMTKLQPQLTQQCIKTEEFLKRLSIDKEQANIVERQVEAKTQDANHQIVQIKAIKEEAQAQLGKAMPMLLEAQQALKKINKSDITQIKGYANPHASVVMVMEAVCVLLNEKLDWGNIKTIMMQMNFLDRLKGFDKTSISDNTLRKLRSYTTRPDFDPHIVGQKNLASKSLCMWCKAMDNYAKVLKEVEPKKKKLAELQKVFEQKNKILFIKLKQLNRIKEKVQKLQKQCEQTLEYQSKLQNDIDLTTKRLSRAEKLTILLKDQGLRWSNTIQTYKLKQLEIPGEAFLSSLILSYLGPFTGSYRETFLAQTIKMMKSSRIMYPTTFSLTSTMFDQITIRDWILEGLPNDSVSIDNAIIAKKGKRFPLMIDPQGQANRWLKVNQKPRKLAICNFDQIYYLKTIQAAVKNGNCVLIEQVEETLQSSIDSLLEKKIQNVEGMNMITIGDKKISYDSNFYLYMTTKMGNPRFLAEVFNKATVINFSITQDGLRDQLLADVCKMQKPQIEKQRDDIIVQVAANKKFLKQSQDKILKMLAESKGMVLDDIELIDTLENSKLKSKEVEKDLEKNSILQEQVNRARNTYLPVATRGTIIYFVIARMSFISPMYEFSLAYVKRLYLQGISRTQFTGMVEVRIRKLNQSVTNILFTNISRSLFEEHKKLYSFLICTAIKRNPTSISGNISSKEWDLFSRGPGLKPKDNKELIPNPDTKIFTDSSWFYLSKMASLPQFANLQNQIKLNIDAFKEYFSHQNIYTNPFPGKQLKIVKNFSLLLLSKIIKPQNLILNMSQYVQKQLGKFYDQSIVTSIEEVLSASQCYTPLLFVLSQGVDPTSSILNYCQSKSIDLFTISLGQGQGKKAQHLIQRAKIDGSWVLLSNCHLSKSWLGTLQSIIQGFNAESIPNQNFRLILSSMPVNYFPTNILQNCNKITLQPPRGLKPNIQRSFKQLHEDVLNYCPNRRKQWLRCLYSISFFHALIQERRKYGALCFNIRYDFNDSDLQMTINTLRIFLNDSREDVNWDAIWYMVGQINYGGRVTDDFDRVCLMSLLKRCLNPQLFSLNEKFFYSDSEEYYCLNCLSLQDFMTSIDRFLPNNESPQVFGLHQNANLIFVLQQSDRISECIKSFEPKQVSGNSSDDGMEIVKNLSQLPPIINIQKLGEHLIGDNDRILPSLTNFLLQQVDKFNNLLNVIRQTLNLLEKAIGGIIPMNQELDEMLSAFRMNRIPKVWRKYSYETMKPLSSWFNDFKSRIQFLDQWVLKANPNAYWISCFFFPQGLLTAILQTHSRKYKIPIDTLTFKFKVTEVEKDKLPVPKDGGYIYGLYMDGARWDSSKDTLADEQINVLNQPMPCILLIPTQGYQIGQNHYNCPAYKTAKRMGVLSTTGQSTNFILGIHLNTKVEKPQYWTLRGTALLCQLNN